MRPVYYLEFDDRAGTERDVFVTFRPHHAWAKRLRVGRVVYLCDSKTRQVYGKAKVRGIEAGKVAEILEQWGWLSHLEPPIPGMLYDANSMPMVGTTKAARAAWAAHAERCAVRRFASIQRRYGPNRVNHDTNLTAIFLKRIK